MAIRWTKTKTILALLATLQLSLLCAQTGSPTDNQDVYTRAEMLVRNHQWDDGLQLLSSLLAQDPHNLKALNLAGIACAAKGDTQKANQYFERSLEVDPHFLPALKNLSINEFNTGQYVSAEKHLLSAQQQLPNDPTINIYLGQIAYRQQKFNLAAERFNRVADVVARNPQLSSYFALSLLRSGQKTQALAVLDRITPSGIDPQTQLDLGIALAQVDMNAQAIPYLQAAFNRDPASYETGFDLALAGVDSKDYPTAIATANDLIRRGHDTSELENILAEALEANGETSEAIDAYRKAIALDPEEEDNYLDLTSLCIDHRAFDEAMKVIALGLQVHPKSERLTFMRGVLHASQDNYELAEADFHQAAVLSPQRDYGLVGLGTVYLNRGNPAEAIKVIRARLRQSPDDASLLYLLGEALIQSGASPGQAAYADAQAALEKSVRLNPGLCLPHVTLGTIYLDEDRFSDAALQFEKARAIDPNENSAYSHLAVAYRRLGQPEKAKEVLAELKQVLEQERAGTRVKAQTPARPPSQ